jgi:hypothetical protein
MSRYFNEGLPLSGVGMAATKTPLDVKEMENR